MRLDLCLVEKFGVSSRQKAQALIMRGDVFLGTQVLLKPGYQVKEKDLPLLKIKEIDPYVGFGAYKLLKALEVFSLMGTLKDSIILDIGSSTGGFTQVLLQQEEVQCVYAVDVGENQLDYRLRENSRVISYEKTDARNLHISHFSRGMPDFFVVDVSFISLVHIFPVLGRFKIPRGIVLIKPQFEIGKEIPNFRGVVKDIEYLQKAIDKVRDYAHNQGFKILDITESPTQNAKKNQEFLALLSIEDTQETKRPPV